MATCCACDASQGCSPGLLNEEGNCRWLGCSPAFTRACKSGAARGDPPASESSLLTRVGADSMATSAANCVHGRYSGWTPLNQGSGGRWNPCCSCYFRSLPDSLIEKEIFSFLDLRSLLSASAVCTRWNYLAEQPHLWRTLRLPPRSAAVPDSAAAASEPMPSAGDCGASSPVSLGCDPAVVSALVEDRSGAANAGVEPAAASADIPLAGAAAVPLGANGCSNATGHCSGTAAGSLVNTSWGEAGGGGSASTACEIDDDRSNARVASAGASGVAAAALGSAPVSAPAAASCAAASASSRSSGASRLRAPCCGVGFNRLLVRHAASVEALQLRGVRRDAGESATPLLANGCRNICCSLCLCPCDHLFVVTACVQGAGLHPLCCCHYRAALSGSLSPSPPAADLPTRVLQCAAMPRLATIDLSASKRLSGDAVVALLRAPGAGSRLSRLILDGVTSIGDAELAAIVAACPRLRHLSIAGCRAITDAGLRCLLEPSSSHTGTVSVSEPALGGAAAAASGGAEASAATAAAPTAAAPSSPSSPSALPLPSPLPSQMPLPLPLRLRRPLACRLVSLNVTSLNDVSADVVAAVAAAAGSRLRILRARGIRDISDALLVTLGARCPRLAVLDIGRANPFGELPDNAVAPVVAPLVAPAAAAALGPAPEAETAVAAAPAPPLARIRAGSGIFPGAASGGSSPTGAEQRARFTSSATASPLAALQPRSADASPAAAAAPGGVASPLALARRSEPRLSATRLLPARAATVVAPAAASDSVESSEIETNSDSGADTDADVDGDRYADGSGSDGWVSSDADGAAGGWSITTPPPLPRACSATHVSDAGLAALAARCPGLRSLALAGHARITDAGWSAALTALPNRPGAGWGLESLDVSYARGFGGAALRQLAARHASSLTELRMAGATGISDADARAALLPLRALTVLDMHACRGLLEASTVSAVANGLHRSGQLRQLRCGGIPCMRLLLAPLGAAISPSGAASSVTPSSLGHRDGPAFDSSADTARGARSAMPAGLPIPAAAAATPPLWPLFPPTLSVLM